VPHRSDTSGWPTTPPNTACRERARDARRLLPLPRLLCDRYRVAARTRNTPDSSTGHLGFRCVADPAAPRTAWRCTCLGDFTITDIDGNHFRCPNPPHVTQLAAHIALPLHTASR
jgi:thioesterase domain-containing protein